MRNQHTVSDVVPREERADKGKWFHDEVSGEFRGRQRIESEWTGRTMVVKIEGKAWFGTMDPFTSCRPDLLEEVVCIGDV